MKPDRMLKGLECIKGGNVINIDGERVRLAALEDGDAYYLVTGWNKHPRVPRGSILCIEKHQKTSSPAEMLVADTKDGHAVIAHHGDVPGLFLVGRIKSIQSWPGKVVKQWEG